MLFESCTCTTKYVVPKEATVSNGKMFQMQTSAWRRDRLDGLDHSFQHGCNELLREFTMEIASTHWHGMGSVKSKESIEQIFAKSTTSFSRNVTHEKSFSLSDPGCNKSSESGNHLFATPCHK